MITLTRLAAEIADFSRDDVIAWIDAGWVRPRWCDSDYELSAGDIARCRFIVELRQEFAIDDEAMPMVLSLIDQVYGLRHDMRLLLTALDRQPAGTRQALAQTIRDLKEREGDD